MPSPVESAIRGVVTKGVVAIAGFNRERKKSKGPNPFLEGMHTPVSEEVTDTALKVTGEIPAALKPFHTPLHDKQRHGMGVVLGIGLGRDDHQIRIDTV